MNEHYFSYGYGSGFRAIEHEFYCYYIVFSYEDMFPEEIDGQHICFAGKDRNYIPDLESNGDGYGTGIYYSEEELREKP